MIADIKLDFRDVLLVPKRSTLTSRKDVDITREFTFLHSKRKWKGVPIVAANMDTTGTIEIAEAISKHGLLTCLHKFYTAADIKKISTKRFFKNIAVTTGIKDEDLAYLESVMKVSSPAFICLDVANGYTERFIKTVEMVRKKYPNATLIAGNVATAEMVEALILAGADIVKIGIGPGSACTTRNKTGVGYPQLSAIIECADAAHGLNGMIMADGGCTVPGDICKAFGAGADFVMLGGMFAGHTESGGDLVERDGKEYKVYYGMSSDAAMMKHYGKKNKYRASEGREMLIPYRGDVEATVQEILGGLRSCCTYIGARKLKSVPKCATFVRVNTQLNEVYAGYDTTKK